MDATLLGQYKGRNGIHLVKSLLSGPRKHLVELFLLNDYLQFTNFKCCFTNFQVLLISFLQTALFGYLKG